MCLENLQDNRTGCVPSKAGFCAQRVTILRKDMIMKSAITIIAATVIALCICGTVQAEAPDVQFREPTPADGATVTEPTVQIEATIAELDHPELLPDLTDVTFRWDGVDYALYDSSLVLMFNFNNVYELG